MSNLFAADVCCGVLCGLLCVLGTTHMMFKSAHNKCSMHAAGLYPQRLKGRARCAADACLVIAKFHSHDSVTHKATVVMYTCSVRHKPIKSMRLDMGLVSQTDADCSCH